MLGKVAGRRTANLFLLWLNVCTYFASVVSYVVLFKLLIFPKFNSVIISQTTFLYLLILHGNVNNIRLINVRSKYKNYLI